VGQGRSARKGRWRQGYQGGRGTGPGTKRVDSSRVDPWDGHGAQPALGGEEGLCARYPDEWL
jgi:hypothetical protein